MSDVETGHDELVYSCQLIWGGMASPESELNVRDNIVGRSMVQELFEDDFLQYFGHWVEETDRTVVLSKFGIFPGFEYYDEIGHFPGLWEVSQTRYGVKDIGYGNSGG